MKNITISSKIDSTFDFEMSSVGIDTKKSKPLFQVDVSPGIHYAVECKKKTGSKWSVTIPKGLIHNGSYKFKLCVIVDEFYFEPIKGQITVVSAKTIEVSGVPVKVEQSKVKEDASPIKESIKDRVVETPVNNPNPKIEKPTLDPEPTPTMPEIKVEETKSADLRVKDILESLNNFTTPDATTTISNIIESSTSKSSGFLKEVEHMLQTREHIRQNKKKKEKSQQIKDIIRNADDKSKK